MIKFLDSNELELVKQVTWALSVIDSSEFRQTILEMRILSKIEKYVIELTQLNKHFQKVVLLHDDTSQHHTNGGSFVR